jgi:hypothetical protein
LALRRFLRAGGAAGLSKADIRHRNLACVIPVQLGSHVEVKVLYAVIEKLVPHGDAYLIPPDVLQVAKRKDGA